jgi:hypothetical protein
VGLERGPLSLVSTTEELLDRNSSGSGLEIREYGRRDPLRRPRGTLYPQISSDFADKGRSLVIVRSRTQAMKFGLVFSLGVRCKSTDVSEKHTASMFRIE